MKARLPAAILLAASGSLMGQPGSAPMAVRSAFLVDSSRGAYLTAMRERLAINQRDRDPFGLSQDVSKVWRPRTGEEETTRQRFAEVIAGLPITGLSTDGSSFVIGVRTFREGDLFSIESKHGTFQATVADIGHDAIHFRDAATGDTATHRFQSPKFESTEDPEAPPAGVYDETAPPVVVP